MAFSKYWPGRVHGGILRVAMRKTLAHWIPAAFCAFISFLALFASIRPGAEWWRPAFFAFLPMCFYFVGAATSGMHREIRDLRKQIVELREMRAA